MKIKLKKLNSLLESAAKKFVTKDEATYFANEWVDTYIKKQPRAGDIGDAVRDLNAWKNNPDQKMEIEVDKSASLLINFHKLGPSLKLKYIHDEAENRAKKYGISIIGLNHGGVHTLNLWTDGLGKRDLISIFMYNGGPDSVVPFGGTDGIFGTNPISYAIPTANKPIIIDMATSEIPFFEFRKCRD